MKLVIKKRDPDVPLPVVEELVTAEQPTLDAKVLKEIDGQPNVLVPWFLITSYARCVHRLQLVSDEMHSRLEAELVQNWYGITHKHKGLIEFDDLVAGRFQLSAREYPAVIRSAAQMFAKLLLGVKIDIDWRTAGG